MQQEHGARGLASDEVVIDTELAKDLNASVGERIRLTSSGGVSDPFTIAGIYNAGRGRGSAYITLRTGQSLFGYGTSVNTVYVKVFEIYDVDGLSDTIMALTPYEARPWTRDFSTFLKNMQMMGASAYLISVFSLIASAFAIASVLIVSVLQKSAQIGILKSMGARQRQILTVFVFEGLGVARDVTAGHDGSRSCHRTVVDNEQLNDKSLRHSKFHRAMLQYPLGQ